MAYIGDFRLGDTFDTKFTTVNTSGAPTTLAGSPVISAYVGNNTTELTAGITLSVDFDGRTGMHNIRVVATSGNGYATASNYQLVITTGTVGGTSVVGYVVGEFSIEARSAVMPTTAARTLDVSSGGEAGIDWANIGSPTTANTFGNITYGNFTTSGTTTLTGNVLLSDGLTIAAPSTTDRAGITITGNGAGAGITSTGGSTGHGIKAASGATSGDAINAVAATSGHGLTVTGAGTTKHGINATGSATNGSGISSVGGGTGHGILAQSGGGVSGDGIRAQSGAANGNGAQIIGIGTGHGILATSGGGSTGDGIKANAASTNGHGLEVIGAGTGSGMLATKGSTGSDIAANITGNITGNLSGSVGSVTGLTASNLDTTVSSRMATYTQPTGFLAATFPSSVASPTNITAGTITTVTNLTTNNDKTGYSLSSSQTFNTTGNITGNLSGSVGSVTGAVGSVTGAVGSVTGAVGSVTGNVGGNVVGSVGSVTGLTASNLDATVSSRLASASYTAPDNADIALIKTQTDKMTFTVTNQIDSNIHYVNDIQVDGSGTTLDPWGPV